MNSKNEIIRNIVESNTEYWIYSGSMRYMSVAKFIDDIRNYKSSERKTRCVLILTTDGGDPDAAFRLATSLKQRNEKFEICVFGPCKSAGTLIALGASKILYGPAGELGPLDVQISKPDELVPSNSGLDIFQALTFVTESAFRAFEQYMLSLVQKSGGQISTTTAAHIASSMATDLFQPLMSQIDPERLGELQRAVQIAEKYGELLDSGNLQSDALNKLITGYPSHSFVIDFQQAKAIFKEVEMLDGVDSDAARLCEKHIRHPSEEVVSYELSRDLTEILEQKNVVSEREPRSAQSDVQGRTQNGAADSRRRGGAGSQPSKPSRKSADERTREPDDKKRN